VAVNPSTGTRARVQRTTFDESLVGIGSAIAVFGLAFGWLLYDVVVEGPTPGRTLDLHTGSVLAWALLVGAGLLFLLSLLRLGVRHRVVVEPDRIRFGVGARFHVERTDVAAVEKVGRNVRLRLHAPDDAEVRRRAGLHGDTEVVHLDVARYRFGELLPTTLTTWYADAP
jgi:hypothetical protein